MANSLHNTGEEYYQDKLDGELFDVGLYNDATATLTDSSDLSDIGTAEPDTGNYARAIDVTFNAVASGGDYRLVNAATITFDVTNTTETVDSAFVVVNFDSDVAGDAGTPADHLLFTAPLTDGTADLSQNTTFDLTTVALDLS